MGKVTEQMRLFEGITPQELVERYGSPLYVYNERVFRERCRDVLRMCEYPRFEVNYSVKANTNIELLKIARQEGMKADALSEGEMRAELLAGFTPEEIFFVPNNISADEARFAAETGVVTSADSLSQLKTFAKAGLKNVALRVNPGVGAGHHEKVVTAGKKTKFGIDIEFLREARDIAANEGMSIVGLNQHIGSGFDDPDKFAAAAENILAEALSFPDLKFIDFGGGFNIPYHKADGEKPLNLKDFGRKIDEAAFAFAKSYGRDITFKVEPGRYIAAECGVLLGTATAVKTVGGRCYVGTDIGFSVLIRPAMYGAWHEVEFFPERPNAPREATVVGNICESGDIIALDRNLPIPEEGDVIAVLDAGAYGMSMASNYNCRPRPAEVLASEGGKTRLVRRRDNFDDLFKPYLEI